LIVRRSAGAAAGFRPAESFPKPFPKSLIGL
jgi:hypothetical protein